MVDGVRLRMMMTFIGQQNPVASEIQKRYKHLLVISDDVPLETPKMGS